jgi:CRISPR system Cascade subunit CasA
MMNLINDRWIPIRRADGSKDKITPWEITQDIHDEKRKIIAVASPRPDFDGALTQFFIGILQTACTPDDDTWWDWLDTPPEPKKLQSYLTPFSASFELDGPGPRFMQDYQPAELSDTSDIGALLIETPGENAIKKSTDHFIKRNSVQQLCADCAATALYTMQLNAPAGGVGYRVGLRGGGPLTTIVVGKVLWETCWLNVLTRTNYISNPMLKAEIDSPLRFPWLTQTRISIPKVGQDTYWGDIHPDQLFWGMPRRKYLISEDVPKAAICDLCGKKTTKVFKRYKKKNYGTNYVGTFEHTLSPHYMDDNNLRPIHPQPGGYGYRHWLGFIENSVVGKTERRPAKVINQFRSLSSNDGSLWAFGYDMDNMKARCWYDSKMPILIINKKQKDVYKGHAVQLIQSANWIADSLLKKVKKALFGESEVRGNTAYIKALFWQKTESFFYQTMNLLRDALTSEQSTAGILLIWRDQITKETISIFDETSQTGDFDAVNPRRVATARNELCGIIYGDKLKDILGIPTDKNKKKKR